MTTLVDTLEAFGQRLAAFVDGPGRAFIGHDGPVDDDRIAMNVVAGSRLTHDEELAARADRVLALSDGRLVARS